MCKERMSMCRVTQQAILGVVEMTAGLMNHAEAQSNCTFRAD